MTYAMSDIHGCYKQYMKMLETIEFADDDLLYVLGDLVDWGPQPMEVLRDMSVRANVIPILGNHDYIAHKTLGQLLLDFTAENLKKHFGGDDAVERFYLDVAEWQKIGGDPTIKGFGKLSMDIREGIIEYLSDFSLYEEVEMDGQTYILTHIGLPDGATPDNLDDFDAYDFIGPEIHTDYSKAYSGCGEWQDIILVTGHLPTYEIGEAHRGRIYRKHNHIAIDTGAAFGEALGCVCLETGEEFYEK